MEPSANRQGRARIVTPYTTLALISIKASRARRSAAKLLTKDEARRIAASCRSYCGGHTARSQSAIQCLPVRPRISLIRLTMRVTSPSALKKAAEVTPDVRKKAKNLLKFRNREGHCRVPIFHNEGRVRLGWWVSSLRARQKKLSGERKARLNKIGFVWKADKGGRAHTRYRPH